MACPRAAASPSPSHPRRSIPRPRRWRISPRSPSFGATPSCRRSSPSRRSSRWRCARPIARSPTVSRPSACGPGSSMPRRRSTTASGPLCAATTMSPWSAAIPSRSRPSPSSSACSSRRVSPSSGSCPTPRALTAPSGPDRPPLAASFMTAMELLIPSWADLAAWAGVLVAALVFIGVGRLLSRGRAAPEAALVAGWGGACVALTLWGVATAASLRWPATAIAAAGLVGVVALPLLAVMVSARPSLPDTFLNLLPNAAYLYDHAGFPADDRSPSHSFLPGAPYNMQLAAFTAALFTPGFPPAAMIGINLILQLAFALFLARLIERGDDAAAILPTWGATALGLLLATLINPGFVPRYHLSAYSETSVTVALAFAAWFAARALDRCAAQRTASAELTLLALTLAALVNIKQDSIALVAGLLGAALVLALLQGREGRGRAQAAALRAMAVRQYPAHPAQHAEGDAGEELFLRRGGAGGRRPHLAPAAPRARPDDACRRVVRRRDARLRRRSLRDVYRPFSRADERRGAFLFPLQHASRAAARADAAVAGA